MAGKPLIVAILAAMVVGMIGVVFLQKAPEGFVLSGLLRIADGEQERLEEQLRKEAEIELASQKEKAIDPASISLVKASNQGDGKGLTVAVQAQGKDAPTAIDYLNALLIRYARREGRTEEMVKTKLEIAESERKLEQAVKTVAVTSEKIVSTEKEIKQLLERERIEMERMALKEAEKPVEQARQLPPPKIVAPKLPKAPEVAVAPTRESEPMVKEVAEPEVAPFPAPLLSARKTGQEPSVSRPPAIEEEEPESAAQPALSEEERLELGDTLALLKTKRMKLINDGRRSAHPAVQDLDRQIKEIEMQLGPKTKRAATSRKVKFEYGAEQSRESAALVAVRNSRIKLENELKNLNRRLEQAERTQIAMKQKLVTLVAQHDAQDAVFKPVVLAETKIVTQISAPFAYSRLIGTLLGALIAGAVGYLFAKLAEAPKVLTSILEAETILRMPVQTLEKTVRRRAA